MPLISDHFSFSWKNSGYVVLILSSSSREVNTCMIISVGYILKDTSQETPRKASFKDGGKAGVGGTSHI